MTQHEEQTTIEPGLERFLVALIYGTVMGILIGIFIGWLIWA